MTSENVPGVLARRRAESSWRAAARALASSDVESALTAFRTTVELDPGCADGWLGLHHISIDRAEALWAMERHGARLGDLRMRSKTLLSSAYSLGRHLPVQRIENRLHLWRAVIAHQIETGQYTDAAGRLLAATVPDDHVRILRLNLALAASDWTGVLTWGKGITGELFARYATLHVGRSLVELGAYREATRTLLGVIDSADDAMLRADAAGWCARAYERLNQADNAERFYQFAFRLDPTGDPNIAARATVKAIAINGAPASAGSVAPLADDRRAVLAEAMKQVESLTGLEPVKTQFRTLAAQLRVGAARVAQGLPASPQARHYVFTGPPGTGKTTLARILLRILYGYGYIDRPEVREVHRVDLVGQYLGATAIKTNAVIDSALDGGLFIDEAYALFNRGYAGGRDALGDEALQTLLKRAEDDRDRLVIILAGYSDEMDELLSVNPGLASRFTTRVQFPSYTATELLSIASAMASAGENTFDGAATRKLESIMSTVCGDQRIDALGNARFVRNLYEKAVAHRDLRLAESGEPLTVPAITTIKVDDLAMAFGALAG